MPESNTPQQPINDPLLNRFFLSPEEKKKKENGHKIIKAFYSQQTNNNQNLNFYKARSVRMTELKLWAKGSQSSKEFMDYMNVSDANKAWINMDTTPQRVAPQFINTLVESMAKNKTYPCVSAIDDGSMSEKEQRYFDAIFRMHEAETINKLQQEAGVQIEPSGVFVPNDEISAKVYFQLEDRLPKEIRFEEMLNYVKSSIQFERIANRKTLYDLVVTNLAATKIEKLGAKQYSVRKCVDSNMIYNFFMNDNGDCEITMIGEFYNLKVKDFRKKLGKSEDNPDGLTEKEIFDLAKAANQKNIGQFNWMWDNNYSLMNYFGNRPYDDFSILVLDAEINCAEDVYYVSKKDSFGREDIQEKKNVPYRQVKKNGEIIEQEKPEDVEIIKKQRNGWMRGIYAPYGDKMLYWGQPDLIINEYTNTSKPLSSYSINIPNNDGEYVPSLFERIMEPLREYSLVKLKRKQIIALIEPDGFRIDVENVRNIDLGSGDSITWDEVVRIKNQTGVELWSSKGVDPLAPQAPPFSQGTQSNNLSKIMELTNVLAGIMSEIRQLIGVPNYRDGSDVGDRTAARLAEGQTQSSYNVTDYVLNANNQLWEESFYKLCLLHWNDIVKEEPETSDDLLNTKFSVTVKMKSTEYEKQLVENDIQRYSQILDGQGNPLLSPKDAMMIRQIDNYQLAMWYLTKTYEENRNKSIEQSKMLQEQNAQTQQQSAKLAAEEATKLQQEKLASDKDMEEFKSVRKKEEILLQGFLAVAAKDESGNLIKQFLPAIQQLVPNITVPLALENKQMQEDIIASEQEQQMAMEEQAMAEQQERQPLQQMEQPQMA